jgi:hypothetical protein
MRHRTALITAGSIAAVVLAGAVAIGANLGILTVADSSPIGKLSASAPAQANAGKVVEVYTGQVSQKYIIRKAGTVEVAASGGAVRVVSVHAARRWKWALTQTANGKLMITFRFKSTTYQFSAIAGRGGTILARVVQPVTKVVTAPAAAQPAPAAASVVSWSASPAASSAAPATASVRPAAATPRASASGDGSDHHSGGGQDD